MQELYNHVLGQAELGYYWQLPPKFLQVEKEDRGRNKQPIAIVHTSTRNGLWSGIVEWKTKDQ